MVRVISVARAPSTWQLGMWLHAYAMNDSPFNFFCLNNNIIMIISTAQILKKPSHFTKNMTGVGELVKVHVQKSNKESKN